MFILFSATTSDLSSSLDVTNISDPNAEVPEKASANDHSASGLDVVGEEGVFTSTPLAATVLRSSSVPNLIQPVAYLEVSDDSETSKRSCKLWIFSTPA